MLFLRNILILCATTSLLFFSQSEKRVNRFTDIIETEKQVNTWEVVHVFSDTIKIEDYFNVMDRIVARYDSLLTYPISEHLIVRNNPWIIDSLAGSDYYHLKKQGITSLNPKKLTIFKPGQQMVIPDSTAVDSLNQLFE